MPVLFAEPPEDKPSGTLPDPSFMAAHDQLSTQVSDPTLWTYGGQARHRDAARQDGWL